MLITALCLSTQDVREEFLTAVFLRTLSYIKKKLETKTLCLPQPVPLNGREKSVPIFFIGDEVFL